MGYMPRRTGYPPKRRRRSRRRLMKNPTKTITKYTRPRVDATSMTLARHANTVTNAVMATKEIVDNWQKMSGMLKARSNVKSLRQTGLVQRGKMNRHEKLKVSGIGPLNKGKGFNSTANGVVTTHGKSVIP